MATDTDVGKTVVSRALIRAWRADGQRVCAIKPVSTGCRRTRGGWSGGDAPSLHEAADDECDALLLRHGIRPGEAMVSFRNPMGPVSAARAEGRRIPTASIGRRLRKLADDCERHDVRLVIEGVGGPMVPLGARTTFADLAARTELPCVLATRTTLGTISQTLMAAECLATRGIRIAAIVASRDRPGPLTAVERAGLREIDENTPGIPLVVLRHLRSP